MALAAETVFPATFGFIDNNRKRSSTSLYLPPTATVADTSNYVTAIATAMDALSSAGLDFASFSVPFFDEAVSPLLLPPESEVERKLVLIFGTGNRYVDITIEVPSPVFTLETAGTDEVDPANPLVAALTDLIINGFGGLENSAVAASGLSATVLKRAYIRHRNRRPS